jgi:uncharacterized protein (TIGR02145 family)
MKTAFFIFVVTAAMLTNIAFAQSTICDTETKNAKAIYDRCAKMVQASTSSYTKCMEEYKVLSEQATSGQAKCLQEKQAQTVKATSDYAKCQEASGYTKCLQEYQATSDYSKCLEASGYTKCQQEYQARLMQTQATSGQTKCVEEYKVQMAQGVKTAVNDYTKCMGAIQAIIAEANKGLLSDYTKCLEASGYTKCQQEYQTQTAKTTSDYTKCLETSGYTKCTQEYLTQTAKATSDYAKCSEEYKVLSEQVASGQSKCQQEYETQQAKIDTKAYIKCQQEYLTQQAKADKICAEAAFKAKAKGVDKGSFTDSRDGKRYKTVKFDNRTWMAENLNYNADGSKCYNNQDSNCQKYGRLYNWSTAKTACPEDWHLPSDAEWQVLVDFAGGYNAGHILKASSGWESNGNGVGAFGFSALPGGLGNSDGGFNYAGYGGYWWSATEIGASNAWNRDMYYYDADVYRLSYDKTSLFSVRCVQD